MSDSSNSNNDLFNELSALGGNLAKLARAAWESPERKKLQTELETAFADLGQTLNRASADFLSSPTGQQIVMEFNQLRERVRESGLTSAAYEEAVALLQRLNAELNKAAAKMNPDQGDDAGNWV